MFLLRSPSADRVRSYILSLSVLYRLGRPVLSAVRHRSGVSFLYDVHVDHITALHHSQGPRRADGYLWILHRAHVPYSLSKHRRHVSPACPECKTEAGDLTHCYWSCVKIQQYWNNILFETQKVLNKKLSPRFLLCLPNGRVTDMYQK